MREEKMKSKDRNTKVVRRSKFKEVWRRLKKSRTAMIGLVILIIISAAALIGPMFIDYEQDVIKQNIRDRLQGPRWSEDFAAHWNCLVCHLLYDRSFSGSCRRVLRRGA